MHTFRLGISGFPFLDYLYLIGLDTRGRGLDTRGRGWQAVQEHAELPRRAWKAYFRVLMALVTC